MVADKIGATLSYFCETITANLGANRWNKNKGCASQWRIRSINGVSRRLQDTMVTDRQVAILKRVKKPHCIIGPEHGQSRTSNTKPILRLKINMFRADDTYIQGDLKKT